MKYQDCYNNVYKNVKTENDYFNMIDVAATRERGVMEETDQNIYYYKYQKIRSEVTFIRNHNRGLWLLPRAYEPLTFLCILRNKAEQVLTELQG